MPGINMLHAKLRRPTQHHYGTGPSPAMLAHQAIEADRLDAENDILRGRLNSMSRELTEMAMINLRLVGQIAEHDNLIRAHQATESMLLARCERAESGDSHQRYKQDIADLRTRLAEIAAQEQSMMDQVRKLGQTIDERDKTIDERDTTIADLMKENEALGRQHTYMVEKMRAQQPENDDENYLLSKYDTTFGMYRAEV